MSFAGHVYDMLARQKLNSDKHTYACSYAIYGLAEHFQATSDLLIAENILKITSQSPLRLIQSLVIQI